MISGSPILRIEDHNDIVEMDSRSSSGGEGTVLGAIYHGMPVAVKRFKPHAQNWQTLYREVAVMSLMMASPHIVNFLGVYEDDDVDEEDHQECIADQAEEVQQQLSMSGKKKLHMVMDFAYNENLRSPLTSAGDALSMRMRRRIMYDVCRGLASLHAQGIAHEDLKCENILLDYGLRARLCDFGHARHIDSTANFERSSGTMGLRSPEKERFCKGFVDEPYDRLKSDVYSLGKIIQEIFEVIDTDCTYFKMISACLSDEPGKRPSCKDLIDEFNPGRPEYGEFRSLEEKPLDSEVGRVNVCFNWTESRPSEPHEVKEVRKLVFLQNYKPAWDLLRGEEARFAGCGLSCVRLVFLGILRFHGYGCEGADFCRGQ